MVGSGRWVAVEVVCLLDLLATDSALVRILVPRLTGWFRGILEFPPDSVFMRRLSFLRFDLWFAVEI